MSSLNDHFSPTWIEPQPVDLPPDLVSFLEGRTHLAQALVRLGINTPEDAGPFLFPDLYTPAPPTDLADLDRLVTLLSRSIENGEKIAVWGDFDVDGQTSTAILVSALRTLQADVVYHVPIRADESHGVNIRWLKRLIDDGVTVVLTCDTGISAAEAVEFAHHHGVLFLITDHHSLPEELPPADACVNPQRLPAGHPLRTLSGAGVAFLVAQELLTRHHLGEKSAILLDLAAMGLVADLAEVAGDTRYLIQRGLAQLRQTERPAIKGLLTAAGVQQDRLHEEHIGFVLGPRLNAAGRLADANPVVEFLLETDPIRVTELISRLEGWNLERKLLCDQVFLGAQAILEQSPHLLDMPALVLGHPAWHAGVVGIVASRLVDLYGKPTILLCMPEGKPAHGSARSIDGVNIVSAISEQAPLLNSFGGHPMAAGLSLPVEHFYAFREGLASSVTSQMAEVKEPKLEVSKFLSLSEITLDLVAEYSLLAPFGPGNPPLLFASTNLQLDEVRPIGTSGEHLRLKVSDSSGVSRWVIWWQGAGAPLPEGNFDLAYTLRESNYQGRAEVQIEWLHWRPSTQAAACRSWRDELKVIDLRNVLDPMIEIKKAQASGVTMIWLEGIPGGQIDGVNRYQLGPADTLTVLTTPSGPLELLAALERVHPKQVLLVGLNPEHNTPQAFLKRLSGMARYGLAHKEGRVTISDLAAATGQRERTIELGIAWLTASGFVTPLSIQDDELVLSPVGSRCEQSLPKIEKQLKIVLQDTNAYRDFFHRASPAVLLGIESSG